MNTQGWVKIHRQIFEWVWYTDISVKVLFLHLLLSAVFDKGGAYGYSLKAGQTITTIKKLASETGLTEQQTRTALNKLKRTGEITVNVTNKFSLVTIVNYSLYQGLDDTEQQTNNKQVTNNQQTSNTQVTRLNKECKNERNKNVRYIYQNKPEEVLRNSFNNFDQRIYSDDEIKERLQAKKDRENESNISAMF